MKKNIVIVVLIVLTFLSSVYAFIQQTAAVASEQRALDNLVLAESARKEADQNAIEARKQERIAISSLILLEECEKKK
jgi:hypothetical protein